MQIDAQTRIFGIIGHPLEHSFSPMIHNIAFQELSYNAVYLPFPMKNLTNLKHTLRQLKIQGLSVTIPHKIRIRRIVDKIDPLALKTGSINTIAWDDAHLLEGFNTDGMGAVHAVRQSGLDVNSKKTLIIGSGGSARAIAFALLEEGVTKIGVLTRNRIQGNILLRSLRLQKPKIDTNFLLMQKNNVKNSLKRSNHSRSAQKRSNTRVKNKILQSPDQLEEYDLIINTTPLGMKNYAEDQTPLESNFLHRGQVIFDIVYNPQETKFIQSARQKKLDVIYGYKMLLYQGALQFKIFTQMEAPTEIMERILIQNLNVKTS